MAKKKASGSRKGSKKRSSRKSRGNNWGLLIGLLGIIVILLVIVSYYYQKQPSELVTQDDVEQPVEDAPAIEREKNENPREEPTTAERSSEKEEIRVEEEGTNPEVPEYEEVDEYYFTKSFDFAWPAYDVNDNVVEHEGYTLNYDERNEQARWVAYKLEKKNLEKARFRRKDNFREDPKVRTGSASPGDYARSGYDRGHLAPAADFTWSSSALDQTFFMSNMSPQLPSFNRGVWRKLEEQVREWAGENDAIYVVTGPVIDKRDKRIGSKNKVTVPEAFFKVVLDIREPEIKAIGFLIENKSSKDEVLSFAVTLDKLELVTGLDFFPLIPDELESSLESQIDVKLWE